MNDCVVLARCSRQRHWKLNSSRDARMMILPHSAEACQSDRGFVAVQNTLSASIRIGQTISEHFGSEKHQLVIPSDVAKVTPLPTKSEIAVCGDMRPTDDLRESGLQFRYRPIRHFEILWVAKLSPRLTLDVAETPPVSHLYLGYAAWFEHSADCAIVFRASSLLKCCRTL
jgi:hypothetical protein